MNSVIRCLVVDDEPLARRAIRELISAVDFISCIGEANDGVDAIDKVRSLSPDLLFLDVRMPGASGLDVLEQTGTEAAVIFTTAHDEYALTAFELGAIDYLRKPFGRDRFQRAVERVRTYLDGRAEPRAESSPLAERLAFVQNVPMPLDRLFVRQANRVLPIKLADVMWFEADGDYVAVYTGGRRHLVYMNLGELCERLDPARFVRIHRSYAVNLDYVEAVVSIDNGRVQVRLHGGVRLAASRAGTRLLRQRVK